MLQTGHEGPAEALQGVHVGFGHGECPQEQESGVEDVFFQDLAVGGNPVDEILHRNFFNIPFGVVEEGSTFGRGVLQDVAGRIQEVLHFGLVAFDQRVILLVHQTHQVRSQTIDWLWLLEVGVEDAVEFHCGHVDMADEGGELDIGGH